jgi:multiple antibiotic resistance protein
MQFVVARPSTAGGSAVDGAAAGEPPAWRSVAFMPVTFPLTIGGTTFGILVAFRADVGSVSGAVGLSIAALAYAAVTGLTIYASGHVARRASPRLQILLGRLAGILLTAIAVTLLVSGGTRMVDSVLRSLGR